ncbi:MAG: hypothetical protein IT555_12570 [Acetobacteraceae bacterium]|nr:hypothetical protein [Acetobacteraceae bacterium]
MREGAANQEWRSPARRAGAPALADTAQPLLMVAEEEAVLTPLVADLCAFLRVRVEHVAPAALAGALARQPVGVLCHAPVTGRAVSQVLRAVVATDAGLPVLVVTDHEASRAARLAVAHDIVQLEHLVWLDRLPDLRGMIDFLFLAERRAGRGGLMPL